MIKRTLPLLAALLSAQALGDNSPAAYDFTFAYSGVVPAGQVINLPVDRAIIIPASLAGSHVSFTYAPSSDATFTLSKNFASVGTVVIHSGGSFTLTAASTINLAAGDTFSMMAPSPANASLTDPGITIAGAVSGVGYLPDGGLTQGQEPFRYFNDAGTNATFDDVKVTIPGFYPVSCPQLIGSGSPVGMGGSASFESDSAGDLVGVGMVSTDDGGMAPYPGEIFIMSGLSDGGGGITIQDENNLFLPQPDYISMGQGLIVIQDEVSDGLNLTNGIVSLGDNTDNLYQTGPTGIEVVADATLGDGDVVFIADTPSVSFPDGGLGRDTVLLSNGSAFISSANGPDLAISATGFLFSSGLVTVQHGVLPGTVLDTCSASIAGTIAHLGGTPTQICICSNTTGSTYAWCGAPIVAGALIFTCGTTTSCP